MVNKKWVQIFAIWISVIVPYYARGQDATASTDSGDDSRITLGAKVGTSFNQFSQPGSFIGVNLGAFGKFKVTDFLDARLELLYSTQGGGRSDYTRVYNDGSDGSTNGVTSITNLNPYVTFNNFEIPLLVELGLPEFKDMAIQPKLLLGGSYSMVMGAIEHKTQRYSFPNSPDANGNAVAPTIVDVGYIRENVTDNYKRSQWAVIAGIGVNYKLGKRTFMMDIRYRQGLTQLNQVVYAVPGIGGKLYSSSLIFNFGMTLFNF